MNAAIKLDKARIREMRRRYIQNHCDICERPLHGLHDVYALVDVDKGRIRCLTCALNPANDNR
jgi:hypothetical protein